MTVPCGPPFDRVATTRRELLDAARGGSGLALECLIAIGDADDEGGDHPVLSLEGVLELLWVLRIGGDALARVYVSVGRDAELVRALVFAVTSGRVPVHKLRDAALGLPVDLELPRLRGEILGNAGAPGEP